MTSRAGNLLIVIAVWAALYFPALGSLAIKGEEGRRILPGISMLETGNYLVPQVGGETYFRKPPLVNWLVAASFKIFGRQNEWTARMPSVISVLLVAIAFVTVARASLGPHGSTIAALIWLINAGIIEKGRLVEIEGLYVSLYALAIIFWLSFWEEKKSAWLTWTVPFVFLGLGWLAKGPLHLVFFYGVVIAVVWKERSWRALFHPAHFVGVVMMLGIFAAWAIPFLQVTGHGTATTKWSQQFTGRLRGTEFCIGGRSTTRTSAGLGRPRSLCDCRSCARFNSALRDARACARVLAARDDSLRGKSAVAAMARWQRVFS